MKYEARIFNDYSSADAPEITNLRKELEVASKEELIAQVKEMNLHNADWACVYEGSSDDLYKAEMANENIDDRIVLGVMANGMIRDKDFRTSTGLSDQSMIMSKKHWQTVPNLMSMTAVDIRRKNLAERNTYSSGRLMKMVRWKPSSRQTR